MSAQAGGVLAVMDAAAQNLAIHCPGADDAAHDDMTQARATVAELIEALKGILRIAKAASIGITGNAPRIAKAEAALARAQGDSDAR